MIKNKEKVKELLDLRYKPEKVLEMIAQEENTPAFCGWRIRKTTEGYRSAAGGSQKQEARHYNPIQPFLPMLEYYAKKKRVQMHSCKGEDDWAKDDINLHIIDEHTQLVAEYYITYIERV